MKGIAEKGARIRYSSEVTGIQGTSGDWQVQLRTGGAIRAKRVVLALGVQGYPRKLGVPGDSLLFVTNTLESADESSQRDDRHRGRGRLGHRGCAGAVAPEPRRWCNRGTEFGARRRSRTRRGDLAG